MDIERRYILLLVDSIILTCSTFKHKAGDIIKQAYSELPEYQKALKIVTDYYLFGWGYESNADYLELKEFQLNHTADSTLVNVLIQQLQPELIPSWMLFYTPDTVGGIEDLLEEGRHSYSDIWSIHREYRVQAKVRALSYLLNHRSFTVGLPGDVKRHILGFII